MVSIPNVIDARPIQRPAWTWVNAPHKIGALPTIPVVETNRIYVGSVSAPISFATNFQCPFHTGLRFSTYARTPSTRSSLV